MQLTSTPAWKALEQHAHTHNYQKNPTYPSSFTLHACGIQIDYSNQHVNEKTLSLLFDLAKMRRLNTQIENLFQGKKLNISENRSALHTALRAPSNSNIFVDGKNIMPEIDSTRKTIQAISEQIRSKQWLGFSGEPIKAIVNIGIGGSDLGPRFCVNALVDFITPGLTLHFISDADPDNFQRTVQNLKPETTLFIISSKSFSTEETLYNTQKAIAWLGEQYVMQQIIAVTANHKAALQYGIEIILPIWDWVGGRFSICSAINLITAIGIGFEKFYELLEGAHAMDMHFQCSPFLENAPVILALLGIWNNNFLQIHNLLFLVYSKKLELFIQHIQQLDMESNGKFLDTEGRKVDYNTGPLIWGGLGNQAQHSYYQLLSQGTHKVTTDFISFKENTGQIINELCDLKIRALTNVETLYNDYSFRTESMPINHLHLDRCSPFIIGALVALYEHKVFAQSVIWGINPFDQPGVASTKRK